MSIIQLPMDPRPALVAEGDLERGIPQKVIWPKMPIRIGREEIIVDGLVQLDYPGHQPHLVVLEIDENGISPASRRRERLLTQVGVPVVRVTGDDIVGDDFVQRLDARLYAAAKTGGRVKRRWAA